MVTLGVVAAGVVAPGSAYAADAVKLKVCNYYTDTSDDGDISVNIRGKNQNGVPTESVSQSISKNQCKTWYGYWWKTDQDVGVWNIRRITSAGSAGFTTHESRIDWRRIPRGVPDGGTQQVNLPNQ